MCCFFSRNPSKQKKGKSPRQKKQKVKEKMAQQQQQQLPPRYSPSFHMPVTARTPPTPNDGAAPSSRRAVTAVFTKGVSVPSITLRPSPITSQSLYSVARMAAAGHGLFLRAPPMHFDPPAEEDVLWAKFLQQQQQQQQSLTLSIPHPSSSGMATVTPQANTVVSSTVEIFTNPYLLGVIPYNHCMCIACHCIPKKVNRSPILWTLQAFIDCNLPTTASDMQAVSLTVMEMKRRYDKLQSRIRNLANTRAQLEQIYTALLSFIYEDLLGGDVQGQRGFSLTFMTCVSDPKNPVNLLGLPGKQFLQLDELFNSITDAKIRFSETVAQIGVAQASIFSSSTIATSPLTSSNNASLDDATTTTKSPNASTRQTSSYSPMRPSRSSPPIFTATSSSNNKNVRYSPYETKQATTVPLKSESESVIAVSAIASSRN
jgi:hypothetical protein